GETVRGTFIGSIRTAFVTPANATATPGNGTLELIGHDLITTTYTDVNTNTGNTRLINSVNTTTEVRVNGSISIVDSATSNNPVATISLTPGVVFIRVEDKAFDTDNRPGTDA